MSSGGNAKSSSPASTLASEDSNRSELPGLLLLGPGGASALPPSCLASGGPPTPCCGGGILLLGPASSASEASCLVTVMDPVDGTAAGGGALEPVSRRKGLNVRGGSRDSPCPDTVSRGRFSAPGEAAIDQSAMSGPPARLVASATRKRLVDAERIRYTIEDFASLPHAVGEQTSSPAMEAHGHKWKLLVFPGGARGHHESWVSLYLMYDGHDSTKPTDACYRMRIVNQADPMASASEGGPENKWVPGAEGIPSYGWSNFIRRDTLLDPAKGFIVDGKVIFEAEVYRAGGTVSSVRKTDEMAESGDLSDVELYCGGQVLHAHKSILGARSEVLCGIFKAGAEGSSGVITVEDIEPAVFKQLLHFMYHDECQEGALEGMADHLLVAASRGPPGQHACVAFCRTRLRCAAALRRVAQAAPCA